MARNTRGLTRVKELLAGTHHTQTRKSFSFSEAKEQQKRNMISKSKQEALKKPGDVWEEKDGNGKVIKIWEVGEAGELRSYHPMMYKMSKDEKLQDILYGYPNCLPDCQTKVKDRLDEKFRRGFGRCADCQFRFEFKLKQEGKYEEYIRDTMYQNAVDWFEDADKEIQLFAEKMRKGVEMEREDGTFLKFVGGMGPDELLAEYEQGKKEVLEKLKSKEENDSKSKANADK